MAAILYLETSAALRPILEAGTSPEVEQRIAEAPVLVTSRLTLVEAARALHRLRADGRLSETQLSDAARVLDSLWARCEIWELTTPVCDLASQVVPTRPLRARSKLCILRLFFWSVDALEKSSW